MPSDKEDEMQPLDFLAPQSEEEIAFTKLRRFIEEKVWAEHQHLRYTRGATYIIWAEVKKILKDEYGIDWEPPRVNID